MTVLIGNLKVQYNEIKGYHRQRVTRYETSAYVYIYIYIYIYIYTHIHMNICTHTHTHTHTHTYIYIYISVYISTDIPVGSSTGMTTRKEGNLSRPQRNNYHELIKSVSWVLHLKYTGIHLLNCVYDNRQLREQTHRSHTSDPVPITMTTKFHHRCKQNNVI